MRCWATKKPHGAAEGPRATRNGLRLSMGSRTGAQHRLAPRLRVSACNILLGAAAWLVPVSPAPVRAQVVAGDTFSDGKDGAKVHVASGFVCPAKIGLFERDAVGESDPSAGADFCAYSTQDGVYGTIKLSPVAGNYDPKISLARDFAEQEATGGKKIFDGELGQPAKNATTPLAIYSRSYETSKLEDLHYRVLFAGAQVKTWAVEAIVEYADPRDASLKQEFLRAVYAEAQSAIGAK